MCEHCFRNQSFTFHKKQMKQSTLQIQLSVLENLAVCSQKAWLHVVQTVLENFLLTEIFLLNLWLFKGQYFVCSVLHVKNTTHNTEIPRNLYIPCAPFLFMQHLGMCVISRVSNFPDVLGIKDYTPWLPVNSVYTWMLLLCILLHTPIVMYPNSMFWSFAIWQCLFP